MEKKKGFFEHLYLKIDKRGFINTYEIKTSFKEHMDHISVFKERTYE